MMFRRPDGTKLVTWPTAASSDGVVRDGATGYLHVADYGTIVRLLAAPDLVPTRSLRELLSPKMDNDIRRFVDDLLTSHLGAKYATLRKQTMAPFAKRLIVEQESSVQEAARKALAKVEAIPFDGVQDVAVPLIRSVLLQIMLGLPAARHGVLILRSMVLAEALRRLSDDPQSSYLTHACRLQLARFKAAVDATLGQVSGHPLWTSATLWQHRYGLLFGILTSVETAATGMIGNLLWLATEQGDRLPHEPQQARLFAFEALRLLPPSGVVHRITTVERQIGTCVAPPGTSVWLWLARGNLDPGVFSHPSEFHLATDRRRALSFGAGTHSCPFAPLMMVVAQSAVMALASVARPLEKSAAPQWNQDVFGYRPRRLPLVFA